MSKSQKQLAEIKHRRAHRFLTKNFPGCEVVYDGVEGLDHKIIFNDKTTWLETKSCKKIILAGLDKKRMAESDEPRIFNHLKSGQFKFEGQHFYPYKVSQHQDLVDLHGWYTFVVGNNMDIFGIQAEKLDKIICGDWKQKRVVWGNVLQYCYPDWLKALKMQVYEI